MCCQSCSQRLTKSDVIETSEASCRYVIGEKTSKQVQSDKLLSFGCNQNWFSPNCVSNKKWFCLISSFFWTVKKMSQAMTSWHDSPSPSPPHFPHHLPLSRSSFSVPLPGWINRINSKAIPFFIEVSSISVDFSWMISLNWLRFFWMTVFPVHNFIWVDGFWNLICSYVEQSTISIKSANCTFMKYGDCFSFPSPPLLAY